MQSLFKHINGDKTIWVIIGVMSIFSFMPIYSASSNLVYTVGGSTFGYMFKHLVHLLLGFAILYGVHKIPYRYFKGLSMLVLPISILLLIVTLASGTVIQGANASRWIRIPIVGLTFQPSALASVALYAYVAQYLTRIKGEKITFKQSILPLWIPVFIVLIFVLPANFSTAALIFIMVLILTFIGGYPIKYLLSIVGVGLLFLTLFILTAKAFPNAFPNRVDTWISRIDNFSKEGSSDENYQINLAKQAIATGGIMGLGPGKSVQKNFLPQSTSDFIYAIIIEEFGFIGGMIILTAYLMLLLRILIVARKAPSTFGSLLVIGVGLPIIIQAIINMAVAVQLFPVTGQTLPLISSGGSSIWMVCLALGMILSVSTSKGEDLDTENIEVEEQNPLDILSETI